MKRFEKSYIQIERYQNNQRLPDFNNVLKVLNHQKPDRMTLMDIFINLVAFEGVLQEKRPDEKDELLTYQFIAKGFKKSGYDYMTVQVPGFEFKTNRHKNATDKTISLNSGAVIKDWESFEKYQWIDPESSDYDLLDRIAQVLPDGMKIIIRGQGGLLENVIALTGYENLCYMIIDEPELVEALFHEVGSRWVRYYDICSRYDSVGALVSNDDWGYNKQTMISPEDLRKYVIPWHKKIVEAIHASGKPAILHSCGQLSAVMDDIINDIKYDGKHSYEDKIFPVEDAYECWSNRIAIIGGIDMDFLCRSTPEAIYKRSVGLLEKSSEKGSYMLGSGNSISNYVPLENYLAMIAAVNWNS